jgi:hypothetical protein
LPQGLATIATVTEKILPISLLAVRLSEDSVGPVIAQFVARRKVYKVEDQTGIAGTYPTQCHHNGEVLSIKGKLALIL